MKVMLCLCLLSSVEYFPVISYQETANLVPSEQTIYSSENDNSLFGENNQIIKTQNFRKRKSGLHSLREMLDGSSQEASKLTTGSSSLISNGADKSLEKSRSKALRHGKPFRAPRFAESVSKEAGLRKPKHLYCQSPLKFPRQTLDENLRFNLLESPNKVEENSNGLSNHEFTIKLPDSEQGPCLKAQEKPRDTFTVINETPKDVVFKMDKRDPLLLTERNGIVKYYPEPYPERTKTRDDEYILFENPAQPMFLSAKNSLPIAPAIDIEQSTIQQKTENKRNSFQSSLNSPPTLIGINQMTQPTFKNQNSLEYSFAPRVTTLSRPCQPEQISGQYPGPPPPTLGLGTFNASQMDNFSQKLQRSSQFIPICPEVDNITEIYWELCKDFGYDEEFFEELKKKHWTEDVLRIKGLPAPPPSFFEPKPIASAPQSSSSESLAIPETKLNSVPQTPLDLAPKSPELPQITQNNPPTLLSEKERILYPTNVFSKTISDNLDNSINFVNTGTKIQRNTLGGWNQQIPTRISSKDLSVLKNIVIPLEARTFTNSGPLQIRSSFPCINYPFQNTETLPDLKVPQTPVMYPSSGFDHVLNNCNNIINRASKEVAEEVVEEEQEIEEPEVESESETEEENSDEATVIAVETFPEFNQIVKTKILNAQMLEQDGNIIFLPESESDEKKDESKSKEGKSVEVEVHVTKFQCKHRNTPENKRMAQMDIKDVNKGETWPHLSFLKLIPLSDSFEEELLARAEMDDIAELLKAAEHNSTSDIPPVTKDPIAAADKGIVDENAPPAEGTGNGGGEGSSTK